MGVQKRAAEDARDKKREASNKRSKLAGLGSQSGSREPADWGAVHPDALHALVVLLTTHDGAVRFGRSRDGMVLSVGIYLSGEAVTVWLDKPEPVEIQLEVLWRDLTARIGSDE